MQALRILSSGLNVAKSVKQFAEEPQRLPWCVGIDRAAEWLAG